MENNYIVYMHVSPSDKRYIGITGQKLNERWKNGNGYKHNRHFWNAINKYGWDNFEHIIIAKGLTKEEAEWLEIELIREWDTTNNKDKGYNISLGGSGACPCSKETKEKLSKLAKERNMTGENNPNYGNYWSDEQKKIASERTKNLCWTGENNPNYGNYWSDEQKKIASEKARERGAWQGESNPMYGKGDTIKGGDNPSAKKVICLETMEIFNCIKDAIKSVNGKGKHLYVAIKKHKKYKGYTFMY